MSLLKNVDGLSKRKKMTLIFLSVISVIIILVIIYLAKSVPAATSIDFTTIRKNLSNQGASPKSPNDTNFESLFRTGYESTETEKQLSKQRASYVDESRARLYVENALMDYYRGDYDEAFRRIERTMSYDSSNFLATRLNAQMNMELRRYKRAYNDLERAKQIPNEDDTVTRDLDVLRKIIRYTRSEIDVLQRHVHKTPSDMLAKARLDELYEQLKE